MPSGTVRLVAALAALSLAPAATSVSGRLHERPAAAWASSHTVRAMTVSADGVILAWLERPFNGRLLLRMQDVASGAILTFPADRTGWDLLAFDDGGRLIATDVDAVSFRNSVITLPPRRNGRWLGSAGVTFQFSGEVVHMTPGQPDSVHVADNLTFQRFGSVLRRQSLTSPTSQPVGPPVPFALDWILDPTGAPLGYHTVEVVPGPESIMALSTGGTSWRELVRFDNDWFNPFRLLAAYGPDEALLTGLAGPPSETGAITALNMRTGATRTAFDGAGREVGAVYDDPLTGEAVGYGLEGAVPGQYWLDGGIARQMALAMARWPGAQLEPLAWSADRQVLVLDVSAPDDPPSTYALLPNGAGARLIAHDFPGLEGGRFGRQDTTSFRARDGAQIPAYVTHPAGGTATQPAPTILLVHGGPHTRDRPDFEPMVQFLAVRGYRVIQPQFRGSTGFGLAWKEAGHRQWGGLMQDDVTDAARWAIASGLTRPGQLCIMGPSYGGYAALQGAVSTPELYRCAISLAGISDLPVMIDWMRARHGEGSRRYAMWRQLIGTDTATLAAVSPARHTRAIEAPVLLMHFEDDRTVPVEQSRLMARALSAQGKRHTLAVFRGGGHELDDPRATAQVLGAVEVFLRQHMPVSVTAP